MTKKKTIILGAIGGSLIIILAITLCVMFLPRRLSLPKKEVASIQITRLSNLNGESVTEPLTYTLPNEDFDKFINELQSIQYNLRFSNIKSRPILNVVIKFKDGTELFMDELNFKHGTKSNNKITFHSDFNKLLLSYFK